MIIAGHVSLAMLSRYSHVRMLAKRRFLRLMVVMKPNATAPLVRDDTGGVGGAGLY
jgi:hypothetical protein